MESRRDFLKKASLLAGTTALASRVPAAIQRALAIQAEPGSSYLDAEHIVFLMQENRSFDHCYGLLKGVRGFNDPRAISLANGLPVWFQSNEIGQTYAPFRLDIQNTKATWMGSLPHGWTDMVAARNKGKMDTWLEAKKAGNSAYQHMPLTMGYYNREDIPFYYALADAFTVCDQHFCSSLTGTSANRSYFWSGTIRENAHDPKSTAHVDNSQINYKNVGWETFPERLQEAGIDWKIYQNELSIPVGFKGEEEDWLANFTDNNLEFSKQYHVRFHPAHRSFMEEEAKRLQQLIQKGDLDEDEEKEVKKQLAKVEDDLNAFSAANFEKLPTLEKEIHRRAFVTNVNDPHYHSLEKINIGGQEVSVPKGDIFHQFRQDVANGKLPMISWLVAPCNFSDHPGAPWYGAWYVAEALDILTHNPEVWKKTIFVLTYDENDGYFDHIPPFVPPRSAYKEDGATTSLDTAAEFVNDKDAIGLGFRVPMVVASPWTKGGFVNSEVFDHTSSIQFMEHFIKKKTGKNVLEKNISAWRRTICGNLTSVFRQASDKIIGKDLKLDRNRYVERIFAAKEKALPGNFNLLEPAQLTKIKEGEDRYSLLASQEPGTKPACAIPYNLSLNAHVEADDLRFDFLCSGDLPKTKPVGSPFQLYALKPYGINKEPLRVWNFAVREDTPLSYAIPLNAFEKSAYHFRAYGPNGFFREFCGDANDPAIRIKVQANPTREALQIAIQHYSGSLTRVEIVDKSYNRETRSIDLQKGDNAVLLPLNDTSGWYDYAIQLPDFPDYIQRFAGHIESGKISITDPLMGQAI